MTQTDDNFLKLNIFWFKKWKVFQNSIINLIFYLKNIEYNNYIIIVINNIINYQYY